MGRKDNDRITKHPDGKHCGFRCKFLSRLIGSLASCSLSGAGLKRDKMGWIATCKAEQEAE